MSSTINLSEKWVKASIIGTIWAASEIVLGSFLHNLKIPFSGNILTSIALIFIISVSYIWKEKGLYWRAGVICAIMKTMSPSAVIFGPMVAIISEALLLEFSVRLFGRTMVGFIIGAMLAMSWNLFQKIINYIIFYGFNIIDVYTNLLSYAQKQLNVHFDLVWTPILALLFIYCALGLVSAIIGIRVGRKVLKQSVSSQASVFTNKFSEFTSKPKHEFNYSLPWLFINIAFITISLFLLNYTSWFYWVPAITGIALIWVYRYKRALRQLSKPRFWISFVLITMITAFVFSKIQSNSFANGLLIGVQMNFRAIIIILGFTVLGTELYNPLIRNFFLKTWFKQLPLALELSFKSLPSMIASTPDFKSIVKNPISVIYQVISQAESRLAELKSNLAQKVFIISGAIGQGKTSLIQQIEKELKSRSITVGGILSVRVVENEATIGYDIVDILNRKSEVFLRISNDESLEKLGRFRIFPNGLEFGVKALNSSEASLCKMIIIDEVGALELENKGWANSITNFSNSSSSHLIISVRDTAVEQVIEKWKFRNYSIFKAYQSDFLAVSNKIAEEISNRNR
jgi:nucleoside-triphosphatase THEP1